MGTLPDSDSAYRAVSEHCPAAWRPPHSSCYNTLGRSQGRCKLHT